MLIIKVENGYGHDLKREDGKLLTTKSDRTFHGWGLKSVQTAADRYDGSIVFIGCMIFSFVTMNIPFALLYIFLGGSFLYSAYSIWKKDKEDRG